MADPNSAVERSDTRPPQSNAAQETPATPRYSFDDLHENARSLLDASPHAVAGALAGDDRKTWTLDAAAKKVNQFLGRTVEVADEEGIA